MTGRFLLTLGGAALIAGLAGCGQEAVSYTADVRPILAHSCGNCHNRTGEGLQASGFSVATYDDVMKGTRFGTVIIPGSSESSNLYRVIAGKVAREIRMPPHHDSSHAQGRGQPLSADQVDTVKRWIDEGAKNN